MKLYTQTDIGLVRSSNQDTVDGGTLYDGALVWTVLCDGMGGANGGSVASDIARNVVKENIGLFDMHSSEYQSEDFLLDIVAKANSNIYHTQRKDPDLKGMGTTLELIVAVQGRAMVAHVGDSRIYLVHNGEINQITVDHSLVQEMVNRGEITPEQAMVHPRKNYITRAVGVIPYIDADYIRLPFAGDDILIACSDGLSNYISMESILNHIRLYEDEALTNALIESAKSRGGGDNISVAVLYANK